MLDPKSGSGIFGFGLGFGGPTRYKIITDEVIKTLSELPDGYEFSVRAFSTTVIAFQNGKFLKNSAAVRLQLQQWFNQHPPNGGTYLYTAIQALLNNSGKAETLYLLADGEISQPEAHLLNNIYTLARNSKKPIHTVGVDLKQGTTAYTTMVTIADNSKGTKKFV